jgi:hypothetical protein
MLQRLIKLEKLTVADLLKVGTVLFLIAKIYFVNDTDHKNFQAKLGEHDTFLKELKETSTILRENLVKLNTLIGRDTFNYRSEVFTNNTWRMN